MAFPLQSNDTHNCEMTYDSKAVIKRKPFPIEKSIGTKPIQQESLLDGAGGWEKGMNKAF